MLGNAPFGFSLIRKYVVSFGNLFSNIQIVRQDNAKSGNYFPVSIDDEGDNVELIKVPLIYSNKDKLLARVDSDPKIDRKDAITLPRIAFEMSSMAYDASRKLSSTQRVGQPSNTSPLFFKSQLVPVPYILNFTVWVATKYQAEGHQIIEQILPFFTPSFPLKLNLIPEMNEILDSPITLKSVSCDDSYKGEYQDRRAIVWTLEFSMVASIFGPIKKIPVIKFVDIGIIAANSSADLSKIYGTVPTTVDVTLQPGLTSNGQPTTDQKQSIDYHLINLSDDWGYAYSITENLNGGEPVVVDSQFSFPFFGLIDQS